mmetsp:Transcript_82757/g.237787  ORF Transcript_82757/g.237787 Transcript_82757/m.237787 type:complete len:85 (-) Transcript_82757:252-506(-)|eukprot:CAMPEP_0177214326 /NCGR_PEP_ID=MMETSP0367-20130122/33635_1 /TAXON_ID=447022 ORGANISM="Scrippsiella hangoei-like, Strain SHHI-4" /NCGR_SAMPLE_ID=MMETSP0367 /ASSEMBLY_ACC=CAM_ASM_000362 /LENGTH=84 /DNA_ID=CAMNT_0018663709 /DNA_START=21 /DNA_END=275 /DNA_ORIENTATION=-
MVNTTNFVIAVLALGALSIQLLMGDSIYPFVGTLMSRNMVLGAFLLAGIVFAMIPAEKSMALAPQLSPNRAKEDVRTGVILALS